MHTHIHTHRGRIHPGGRGGPYSSSVPLFFSFVWHISCALLNLVAMAQGTPPPDAATRPSLSHCAHPRHALVCASIQHPRASFHPRTYRTVHTLLLLGLLLCAATRPHCTQCERDRERGTHSRVYTHRQGKERKVRLCTHTHTHTHTQASQCLPWEIKKW
jgi:hypothetical protein